MRLTKAAALTVLGLLLVGQLGCVPAEPGSKGAAVSSPATASTAPAGDERTAVLGAVRLVVERDLGQQVKLEPFIVKVEPPFAAVIARPTTPEGEAIDYGKIPQYARAVEAGAFDDQVLALLQKVHGNWKVLEYEVGATDFPGQAWAQKHGAPEDIFSE